MKSVLQDDDHGCGMACVAMVTGLDYGTVCRKLFGKSRGSYTNTADLKRALKLAGIRCGDRLIRLKSSETSADIKTDAIFKIRPQNRKTGSWHWVVWDAKKGVFRDPSKKPYKKPRLYSYLPVQRR